jgi:hypothetical protein
VGLGLMMAVPSASWASGLEARIGGFAPRAESDLFFDDAELYTVGKNDWRGVYGGVEYSFGLNDRVELGLHVDGYSRRVSTVYRDYVRDDRSEIAQDLRLSIVPLGFTLRLLPLGDRAAVSPYLAVGGDVFFYRYVEFGYFIDFYSDDLDIVDDSFLSEGAVFGGHAAGGLRVPIGDDFALTGEVRYQFAPVKRMQDDFRNNRLDLNGVSATVGIRLRF